MLKFKTVQLSAESQLHAEKTAIKSQKPKDYIYEALSRERCWQTTKNIRVE